MKKQQSQSNPTGEKKPMRSFQIPRRLIWSVVVLIGPAILGSVVRSFWYFEVINNDEVGIAIQAGQIQGVKQPGIAYDFGLFVGLVKYTDDPALLQRMTAFIANI